MKKISRIMIFSIFVGIGAFLLTGCSGGGNSPSINGNASKVYTVSGSISGLNGSVVLQDNGGDNLNISANGNFSFAGSVSNGSTYQISLLR